MQKPPSRTGIQGSTATYKQGAYRIVMLFETQQDLESECFRLNWIGGDLACHMEPRGGSVVLVRRDRVIGQVAQ